MKFFSSQKDHFFDKTISNLEKMPAMFKYIIFNNQLTDIP